MRRKGDAADDLIENMGWEHEDDDNDYCGLY